MDQAQRLREAIEAWLASARLEDRFHSPTSFLSLERWVDLLVFARECFIWRGQRNALGTFEVALRGPHG